MLSLWSISFFYFVTDVPPDPLFIYSCNDATEPTFFINLPPNELPIQSNFFPLSPSTTLFVTVSFSFSP